MRILVVVHAFPPNSVGGAETYVDAHARMLVTLGHEVTVLTRESDPAREEYAIRREQRDRLDIAWVNNTFRRTRSFAESYANPAIGREVARVIAAVRPEVAHIHHLTCLSTGIVPLLKARCVPIVFTLHDYWLLCHRGQFLDTSYRLCDGPKPDGCRSCLGPAAGLGTAAFAAARVVRAVEQRLPRGPANWIRQTAQHAATTIAPSPIEENVPAEATRRFEHMRLVMSQVTRFLSPSESLRQRFVRAGVDANRIELWSCGHDGTTTRSASLGRAARPLRVGYLGSVMVSKAPHLILEAVAGLPNGAATVDVFGAYMDYHGDDSYRAVIEPLLAAPGATAHGAIAHTAVTAALASIDVLAVPSIWPENSPLVIREAFLAGVPVVASRIGGMPEAVIDGVNGLLFDPGDAAALRRALQRLIDEPALLQALRDGAAATAVRSLDDDASAAVKLYESLLAPQMTGDRLAAVVLHYGNPNETRMAVLSLLGSRRPIDDIIVVDNDPSSRCASTLVDVADRIVHLPNDTNLGYAGGINVGVMAALNRGAARVFLLNNDVVVPPDLIGRLERAMVANPSLGAVGPVVIFRTNPSVIASMGMSYNAATGRMRHPDFGRSVAPRGQGTVPIVVDGLSGCAMLVSRTAFGAAGLLDEAYFFGFEDLDWCLRARRAGLSSAVVPEARVYHEGSASMGGSPKRLYFATRNHLRLAATSGSTNGSSSVFRSSAVVALNVAHAFRARGASLPSRLRAVAMGVKDHFTAKITKATK
jgi:GT2 family glycosyltransferase/glycosyltransferase involved in cell wall biosynthesis